jgi:hypothetical protein
VTVSIGTAALLARRGELKKMRLVRIDRGTRRFMRSAVARKRIESF